jgi:thioredoxin 2
MADAQLDNKGVVTACASCGQRNRIAFSRTNPSPSSPAASIRCGKCHTPLGPVSTPVEAHDASTFDAAVTNSALPVVVDFWAPWCGPCRMVAPELATVAARHAGEYLVLKVNTDAVPELGERYRIQSIPTMAVFGGGKEVGRTTGARPAAGIEQFIESTLARR